MFFKPIGYLFNRKNVNSVACLSVYTVWHYLTNLKLLGFNQSPGAHTMCTKVIYTFLVTQFFLLGNYHKM